MRKYIKQLILLFALFILCMTLILNGSLLLSDTNKNIKPSPNKVIPNIIHYIIFDKQAIDFIAYLSIFSSIKFQKPDIVFIHSNEINFFGNYWSKILQINKSNPIIVKNYISKPTHVYGQLISSTYHASDVARIKILQQWGGIYLDTDMVVLKNLDKFRHYDMVLGWPKNEYMGTQILLSKKNAPFLKFWMDGYKRYVPSNWYYNAGQFPTEQILEKMPHLAYRVPEVFGVQNLLQELYSGTNWTEWKDFYAIHLLSRHPPAPTFINETLLDQINNTFKDIARYILFT